MIGRGNGERGADWTGERIALLKKLWADGLSVSQVAVELRHVTRAAVCGMVHRLKLPARRTTSSGRPGRKPRGDGGRLSRKVAKLDPARKRLADGALVPHLPPEPDPPPVGALHIALGELESHHCRWPFGDGPFTFCGHMKAGDGPYCAYHTMLATTRRA